MSAVMQYWRNVSYISAGRAFAKIGWNHPRNAILPTAVSLIAAALVWYETHDWDGFKGRAMVTIAAFGTLLILFLLAFIWQMIVTPPQLTHEESLRSASIIAQLKFEASSAESQTERRSKALREAVNDWIQRGNQLIPMIKAITDVKRDTLFTARNHVECWEREVTAFVAESWSDELAWFQSDTRNNGTYFTGPPEKTHLYNRVQDLIIRLRELLAKHVITT